MHSKDYYKILEVSSTASLADIKKSYRRLAMKYHPDKNFENKLFEIKFREIQEAYHVLSDNKRRQKYNHKTYDEKHGLNKKPSYDFNSPQAILHKTIQLRKKVTAMDPHRLDRDRLYNGIQLILSPHNINVLKTKKDKDSNKMIIEEVLNVSSLLQYKQAIKLCDQFQSIAGTDKTLQQKINEFRNRQKLHDYWNRYHMIAALIAAALFCVLIYTLST